MPAAEKGALTIRLQRSLTNSQILPQLPLAPPAKSFKFISEGEQCDRD